MTIIGAADAAAKAATPNDTTDVNNGARKNEAVITV